MGQFSLPKPDWRIESLQLPGTIWRVLRENGTGHWALELRDTEARTTFFPGVDHQSWAPMAGSIAQPVGLAEGWWTHLEAVQDGWALLSRYPDPNLPEPLGLIGVQLAASENHWYQPTLRYVQANEQGLFALNAGIREALWQVAIPTGDLLQEISPDKLPDPETMGLLHPQLLDESAAAFTQLAGWISELHGKAPIPHLDALNLPAPEGHTRLAMSYYLPDTTAQVPDPAEPRHLSHWLWVQDEDKIQHHVCLARHTQRLALDPFLFAPSPEDAHESGFLVFRQEATTLARIQVP